MKKHNLRLFWPEKPKTRFFLKKKQQYNFKPLYCCNFNYKIRIKLNKLHFGPLLAQKLEKNFFPLKSLMSILSL